MPHPRVADPRSEQVCSLIPMKIMEAFEAARGDVSMSTFLYKTFILGWYEEWKILHPEWEEQHAVKPRV